MKTLTMRDNIHGRKTKVIAKEVYQTTAGKWVAEVDEKEIQRACFDLYRGVKDCTCEDLHVEADQDDDGKEYIVSGSK
jgi:hypothetical protein